MYCAPAPKGRYYRPELDVVRTLAFLLDLILFRILLGCDGTTSRCNLVGHCLGNDCQSRYWGLWIRTLSLFFALGAFLDCPNSLLRERLAVSTDRGERVLYLLPYHG